MDQSNEAKPSVSGWRRAIAVAKSALLWTGGVLFLLVAGGHQIQHPSSWTFVGLIIAALALLPPSRDFISRLLVLSGRQTTLLVLIAGGTGLVMMANDDKSKKDAEAVAVGYASHSDQTRASSLGFTSAAELAAHDAKIKAESVAATAKAAAEAAEAERIRDEQAERVRIAAAETERLKEADCKNDLQCWGDKHSIKAAFACRPYVERLAKYQFEWTDGWLDVKFPRFRWKKKGDGQLTYIGDRIKFQNGFGAWQYYIYTCGYDPLADVVLDVNASPGRLPE